MAETFSVNEFIARLREAEERRDPTLLADLFHESAKLESLTRTTHSKAHGGCGALQFWNQYLLAFDYVSSHFTNVLETDGTAVLEWHSTGRLPMGTPVEYCGVSIVEHDGNSITAFRTYYDSAALLPHAPNTTKNFSESVGTPEIRTDASS